MNEIVKIRYDIIRLKFVDNAIFTETKTIFINDDDYLSDKATLDGKAEKNLNWIETNLRALINSGVNQVNLEMKYSLKTKMIPHNNEHRQTEERELNIYDLSDNSFIMIDNFCLEDSLTALISKNKEKGRMKNSGCEIPTKFIITEEILSNLIRQFIKSISFENLSGGSLKYNLNHVNQKIFDKDISIFVTPTEMYDDQGYKSEPVTIINNGLLIHMFSLNENSQLHSSCIGGYVTLNEYRRPSIEVNNISITTKIIDQLPKKINPKYKVDKAKLNESGVVCLGLTDEDNLTYQITDTIASFLNSLVYVKKQQIYYYSK